MGTAMHKQLLCLEESGARQLLEEINEVVGRKMRQGASADHAVLAVVPISQKGKEADEKPYFSVGGCCFLPGSEDPSYGIIIQQLEGAIHFADQGKLQLGCGDPDVTMKLEHLMSEIGSFASSTARNYATVYMRSKELVKVFLNDRLVTGQEEIHGLLQRVRTML